MPYSNYPRVDDSSSQGVFAYQESLEANDYTNISDYSLATYFDTDSFFENPFTSVETMPSGSASKPSSFSPTLPATGIPSLETQLGQGQSYYNLSNEQMNQITSGYSLDPASIHTAEPASFSPTTQTSSRTPSLCGDAPQPAHSPSLSPRVVKCESPFSPVSVEEETTPKRPLRKRGRPRLERFSTDLSNEGGSSAKCPRGGRLPHNQVERKYREGLNSEMERLRRAVPTLPQGNDEGAIGQPKPSKAMVLSSAIEYIRKIERELEAAKNENEKLRQNKNQASGWTGGSNSLDDFLMDT